MKGCRSNMPVAATKSTILKCKYNCKSDGDNNARVTCVHYLVPLYLFILLLCNGLAEHFLLELNACLTTDKFKHNKMEGVKLLESVRLLATYDNGERNDSELTYNIDILQDIFEYFQLE